MTVALRGISGRATSSSTSFSLTNDVPSLTDGDYMLLVLYANIGVATPPSPPAGWDLVDAEDNGNFYLHVYGKIASSEPASYTITRGADAKEVSAAIIAWYSTEALTLEVDASANQYNTDSLNRTYPGVTTTRASAGLACFGNLSSNGSSVPPGDMTERWDELSGTQRIYSMTSVLTVAGATGDKVATSGSISTESRCVTVAIAEVAAPCKPNASYTYNSVDITNYVNAVDLQNTTREHPNTNLGSVWMTAKAGIGQSQLQVQGDWNPTIDAVLGADAFSKRWRTGVVSLDDCTNTVSYTWTSIVQVREWSISAVATGKLQFRCTLQHNGLGVRSVVAS